MGDIFESAAVGVEEQEKLTMPEKNREAIEAFIAANLNSNERGYPTLCKNLGRYVMHSRLADRAWEAASTNVLVINGEGPKRGKMSAEELAARTARSFFGSLSSGQLTQQCKVYGLTKTDYETEDAIIEALVNAQVAMLGHTNGTGE